MKDAEYQKRLMAITEVYQKKINILCEEYLSSNAKFKIGDIITDGVTIIEVEYFSNMQLGSPTPCGYYRGPMLTKKLTLYKNGDYGSLGFHQEDKIKLIKKGNQVEHTKN